MDLSEEQATYPDDEINGEDEKDELAGNPKGELQERVQGLGPKYTPDAISYTHHRAQDGDAWTCTLNVANVASYTRTQVSKRMGERATAMRALSDWGRLRPRLLGGSPVESPPPRKASARHKVEELRIRVDQLLQRPDSQARREAAVAACPPSPRRGVTNEIAASMYEQAARLMQQAMLLMAEARAYEIRCGAIERDKERTAV